jgi:signal transduction histidine kinase
MRSSIGGLLEAYRITTRNPLSAGNFGRCRSSPPHPFAGSQDKIVHILEREATRMGVQITGSFFSGHHRGFRAVEATIRALRIKMLRRPHRRFSTFRFKLIPSFILLFAGLPVFALSRSPVTGANNSQTASDGERDQGAVDLSGLGDQVQLDHGWLFHPGDDPSFASPMLDDREWLPVDLKKSLPSYGFEGLRFGWLRLHIHIPAGKEDNVLGIQRSYGRYQVFSNGLLLATVGDMNRHDHYDRSIINIIPLPNSPERDVVLAIRVSLQRVASIGVGPETPFRKGGIILGKERSLRQGDLPQVARAFAPLALNLIPGLVTGIIALVLFLSLRDRREYLILAAYCFADSALALERIVSLALVYDTRMLIVEWLMFVLTYLTLISFVRELLSLRHTWQWWILELAVVVLFSSALVTSMGSRLAIGLGNRGTVALIFIILAIALFRVSRRGSLDATILLTGLCVSTSLELYETYRWLVMYIPFGSSIGALYQFGTFKVESDTLIDLTLELSILVFLVVRTVRIANEGKQAAYELEVAILARYNERLSERTRIARELHDTLLQSFQGLMLRFQTVDEMLPARPMEAKEALEGALNRGDQAISEGRDAITDLRTSAVPGHDLEESITALMTDLSEEPGASNGGSVAFRVLVEGAPRTVNQTLQGEIYRIAREALGNAFHHAQARHIEVEITYGESLRLCFRDDGKGIDPNVVKDGGRPGHWGLPGIRERAKQIGAQVEVWTELGAGTEIVLSLPGSIAYEVYPTKARFRIFPKNGAR